MDFIDQIKLLSKRVEQIKEQIQTEEATKMSLIMPLFQALGYDVFNPMEFVPEYTADVGIKKGEKVDYPLFSEVLRLPRRIPSHSEGCRNKTRCTGIWDCSSLLRKAPLSHSCL